MGIMATDKELLAEARQVIAEQSETLERLAAAAMPYGVIIAKDGKKLVVASDKGLLSVEDSGNKIGETVLLEPRSQQIFAVANLPKIGATVEVQNITDFGAEIASHGEPRIVALGQHKPKKGDRVMLDPSGSVVIAVIERAKPPYVPTVEHVSWDDIGGQENAKRLLIEAVELPRKHPQVFAHYGKKPTKGILLSGPPGCGKTMLGKAVATSIGAAGGFISVKGPEILDPYVGVAEANVRDLFRKAEDWKAVHGTEAVVFIDEAEAILAKRGGHFSYMEKTIVPMFLTEMDGLEQSSAIVILATNRPDLLDPAVVRDGRIDYKVEVARPTQQDALAIMNIHIGKKPVHGNRRDVIEKSVGYIYGHPLPHCGALIAGVVEKATARAIARDIAAKKTTGLCHEDFAHAVSVVKDQEMSYAA
jgi:SpoVK/Ycf46/Vps4 family AAA+-type ATPase